MCGHTICEKCIYEIIDKNYNFNCPICKTNLGQLRVGLTYRNYSLKNLMQINEIKSK
jgi:Zn finger protein HypA/HybF involved in hydrogenase expression